MPLCVDRERRSNAGSRMARLLNEAEDDEFYTNVYGGFSEEADDIDYESESSVEDSIDSDFDDSSEEESNEEVSEEDDDKPKRRRRTSELVTKAYREPKRGKPVVSVTSEQSAERQSGDTSRTKEKQPNLSTENAPPFGPRVLRRRATQTTGTEGENKTRRGATNASTALRREALLAEIAQRKNVPEVRRLTQEELLAEAKLTEEINRRSLLRYQRMEIEKKKAIFRKTKETVPMVRFHSFTVPSLDDQPEIYGVAVDTKNSDVRVGPLVTDSSARCCRNLITFADTDCLRAAFPKTTTPLPDPTNPAPAPPRPRRKIRICPISGLPAKYFDPVTLTPYANLAAFRVLRRLYQIHLETKTPAVDLLRDYLEGCYRD